MSTRTTGPATPPKSGPAAPPAPTPAHASANPPGVTTERVWAALEKSSFAVISHVTASGEPRSSGIAFGARDRRIFAVVAAASWKARTIHDGQVVALTVPIRRGGLLSLVMPIPPAVINFHARAKVGEPCVLDKSCLPPKLARMLPDSDELTCVLELTPEGSFLTYGVGVSLMTMRNPDLAAARVPVG